MFFLVRKCISHSRHTKKKCLVTSVSIFLFQFYHACDQEAYSICIVRLSALQFCDFYSAVLAFWVTLIAMAHLPPAVISLLHMAGAVVSLYYCS